MWYMTRKHPGLHEGPFARAERSDNGWKLEIRMKDVCAIFNVPSGVYEFHADGMWVTVGTYPTLRQCEITVFQVKAEGRVFIQAHETEGGDIPGQIHMFMEEKVQERITNAQKSANRADAIT